MFTNVASKINEEKDLFKKKILMRKLEFAREFANLKASEKIEVFDDLKSSDVSWQWIFDNMLCAMQTSLTFSWNKEENVDIFFEFIFLVKDPVFENKRKVVANSKNIDFITQAIRRSCEHEKEVWTYFLINCLSTKQIDNLPEDIKNSSNFRKAFSKKEYLEFLDVES